MTSKGKRKMRITNKMISSSLLSSVTQTRIRMADLQLDMATTKKLRKPSDDPSGIQQAERFKTIQSRNEQYKRNISQISGWITTSSAAIDSAADILVEAKEIAIRGSSGTMDDQTREILANNIDHLIDSLIDLGNKNYNGRFIFGGTLTTGTAPFSRNGDQIDYNGNGGTIRGKIGFEMNIVYNKTGAEVFKSASGVDVFNTMVALKQALEQNDITAIENSIQNLDDAHSQLLSLSSELGIVQNRLGLTEEIIQSENINLTKFISDIEDTDLLQAVVEFQSAETAYNAGLRVMARLVQTSLVDFIS